MRVPRWIVASAALIAAGTAAGAPVGGAFDPAITAQAPAGATLSDLRSVDELATRFNSDAGKIRLVLLLSPT